MYLLGKFEKAFGVAVRGTYKKRYRLVIMGALKWPLHRKVLGLGMGCSLGAEHFRPRDGLGAPASPESDMFNHRCLDLSCLDLSLLRPSFLLALYPSKSLSTSPQAHRQRHVDRPDSPNLAG